MEKIKENFMRKAIEDAKKNSQKYGAVVVKGNEVIAKSGNRPKNDFRFHAETQAILNAGKDLSNCSLYSTCEPCPMCFYMAWATGIKEIYYGATIKDSVATGVPEMNISVKELNKKSGNKIKLFGNFLRSECLDLLKCYD